MSILASLAVIVGLPSVLAKPGKVFGLFGLLKNALICVIFPGFSLKNYSGFSCNCQVYMCGGCAIFVSVFGRYIIDCAISSDFFIYIIFFRQVKVLLSWVFILFCIRQRCSG